MRIIPVIDILNGIAVRGVAGNREQYRPLVSRYCETANPIDVATCLQKKFGFTEFYVADLDAIQKRKPNVELYLQLLEQGIDLLLDAGLSEKTQLVEIQEKIPSTRVSYIIGLETLESWRSLEEMTRSEPITPPLPFPRGEGHHTTSIHESSSNLIFSLDLKHGVPIEDCLDEKLRDPMRIVERAIDSGIRRMIVLDLAQVGTGQGVTTLELCSKIKSQYSDCELITGGGIKSAKDLSPLEDAGIDGVLVASALHNGNLNETTISKYRREN